MCIYVCAVVRQGCADASCGSLIIDCMNVFAGWSGTQCLRHNATVPSRCKPSVMGQCIDTDEYQVLLLLFLCSTIITIIVVVFLRLWVLFCFKNFFLIVFFLKKNVSFVRMHRKKLLVHVHRWDVVKKCVLRVPKVRSFVVRVYMSFFCVCEFSLICVVVCGVGV